MKLEIKGSICEKFSDDWDGLNVVIDDGAGKIPVRFVGFSKEDAALAGVGDKVTVKASLSGRKAKGSDKWFCQVEGGAIAVDGKAARQPGEDNVPF